MREMPPIRPSLVAAVALWLAVAALPACAWQEPEPAPEVAAQDAEDADGADLWSEVQALYEKAKAAGEKVPASTMEWVREDLDRIGDWEYRVLTLSGDAPSIERELNELGGERWECFWVETGAGETRFFLKRPARSYLSTVPVTSLIKLISVGGAGGGGGE
jgi:hypothetical protein